MKKGKPLAKHLCFVIRLDPQSLSCVERPETFLQFVQDIFVHGITCSEIGSIFNVARHYSVSPSGKQPVLPNNMLICTPGYPACEMNHLPWHPSGSRAATVPAPPAHAFLTHPTRFERVTFAVRTFLRPPSPAPSRPVADAGPTHQRSA